MVEVFTAWSCSSFRLHSMAAALQSTAQEDIVIRMKRRERMIMVLVFDCLFLAS